jgi:hypothetical protein
MKLSSYSSLSSLYTAMTNLSDGKSAPSAAIARRENEDDDPGRAGRDKLLSWFVAPIVVPAFLAALIIVRTAYLAWFD